MTTQKTSISSKNKTFKALYNSYKDMWYIETKDEYVICSVDPSSETMEFRKATLMDIDYMSELSDLIEQVRKTF